MGIMAPVARAILREHAHRPLTGDGLLIGRQTVPLTLAEARAMMAEEGVAERADFDASADWVHDKSTRVAQGRNYISDLAFFALFSDISFRTLDVTDYEGAEIVHDMHEPVPEHLHGAFDFIWNGSCLDNMFDPGAAMLSTGRMLKPNGRVICMEMATRHFNAYASFSQSWFFDYFAANAYADCKVYAMCFEPKLLQTGPYHLFCASDYESIELQFSEKSVPSTWAILTLCIAEAGPDTTWDRKPIQSQYRPDPNSLKAMFETYQNTGRPVMSFDKPAANFRIRTHRRARYLGLMRGA